MKSSEISAVPLSPTKQRRRRRTKSSQSFSSDTEGSGNELSSLKSKDFVKSNTREGHLINKEFNSNNLYPSNCGINKENGDVNTQNHGEEVEMSDISEESLVTLSQFVHEQLQGNKVCSLTILRKQMNKTGNSALVTVSDLLLEQNLCKAGATKVDVQWPPNVTSEALYVLYPKGSEAENRTKALVNLFRTGAFKHRRAYLKKKLETALNSEITEAEFAKIIEEYCILGKNGMCYLKCTLQEDST
jgi:hypothetical protein